jgi:prevent-host-death family protein
MDTIGLRELRQNASALVRRVQDGESFTVTVQGRPAAQLVPVRAAAQRRRWVSYADVADVLAAPALPGMAEDLAGLDSSLRDPFENQGEHA